MAVRLGKFCYNGPGLRLQAGHDLWQAEMRVQTEIRHIAHATCGFKGSRKNGGHGSTPDLIYVIASGEYRSTVHCIKAQRRKYA